MAVYIDGNLVRKQASREANSIQFPYTDMSDAMLVAEGLLKGGGVPMSRDQLAATMNLAPGGGGFATKISTARTFGVLESVAGKYQLTDLGHEIVDAGRSAEAKVRAFMNVELFKRIYDEFRGKLLPPRPHGLDAAIISFGVTQKNARHARLAFDKSARMAGMYPNATEDRLVVPVGAPTSNPIGEAVADISGVHAPASIGLASPARAFDGGSKALRYQLIDLLEMDGIGDAESEAIWTLVRFLSSRKKVGE